MAQEDLGDAEEAIKKYWREIGGKQKSEKKEAMKAKRNTDQSAAELNDGVHCFEVMMAEAIPCDEISHNLNAAKLTLDEMIAMVGPGDREVHPQT